MLHTTSRFVNTAIIDQKIIARLGNIYVDEVLFRAKIHPEKRANTLTKKQIELIYKYSYDVLKEAVEQGGTTIRSYVNGDGEMGLFQQELFVYGQENKACKIGRASCRERVEK